MKGKKRQSKRLTLRKKYKILRKVREHKRKVRKTDKQGKKKEKDPGIPNNYPFKAQALAALEQMKLNEEQEKELERLQRIKYAQTKRQQALEKRRKEQEELRLKKERFSVRGSKQKIYGRCREVAEEAEIIVEVVDARDPLGCISPEVEKWIRFNYPDRLFVRLLNKIDLVPKECVTRWLSYLRNEHPALAFKCPIKVKEKKKKNKHGYVFAPKDEPVTHRMTPKTCLGLDNLVQLCKTYAASFSDNRTVTVGVVGWPGVGKASVLQQLRSLKVASLAFEEGHEFHVAPNVRVLDYPGLVIPSSEVSPVDLTLRGCLAPENVPNPYGAAEKIVNRVSKEQLLETYKISMFENVREFLELVAKKGGRQTTGGKPDVTAAAKQVIRDWTSGKIKFFTEPPALTTAPAAADWRSKVGMDALQRAEEEHVLPLLKAAADASFTSYGTAHVFNRAVEPKFLSFLEGRAMDEEVAEDGMDEVAEDEEDGEDEDEEEEEEDGEEDEGEEEEEEEEQKVSKKVSKTTRKAKEVAKGMMALEGDFDFATDFVATSDVAGNIIAVDGEEEEDDDYEDDEEEEEDGGDDDDEEASD